MRPHAPHTPPHGGSELTTRLPTLLTRAATTDSAVGHHRGHLRRGLRHRTSAAHTAGPKDLHAHACGRARGRCRTAPSARPPRAVHGPCTYTRSRAPTTPQLTTSRWRPAALMPPRCHKGTVSQRSRRPTTPSTRAPSTAASNSVLKRILWPSWRVSSSTRHLRIHMDVSGCQSVLYRALRYAGLVNTNAV